MKNYDDLSGKQFGLLTVVQRENYTFEHGWYYLCKCQCGNTSIVRGDNLAQHHSTSCGCKGRKGSNYRVIPKIQIKELSI